MIRWALALFSLAVPVIAGEISLSPPIACDLANDCYIQQYVDRDPGSGVQDFTCSHLSYNGHKGTDFAVPDLIRMQQGVDVLAAAPGTVKGVRDGMPDTGYTSETASAIEGRECGNGVVLDHGGGWETQYCHMKQGSLTVSKGEDVAAGALLGQVGLSGRTEFPHIHLSLRKNGAVVDPFDPTSDQTCSSTRPVSLWVTPLLYRPGGIISMGITEGVPEFSAIKAGTATASKPNSRAESLVLFGYFFGAQQGDRVHLLLTGPDGPIVDQAVAFSRAQALAFRAGGKKNATQIGQKVAIRPM